MASWAAEQAQQWQMEKAKEVNCIRVWPYAQAPAKYRLSTNGGDEDWVAYVPPTLVNTYLPWLQEGSAFGCCSVEVIKLNDGGELHIGSHA